MRLTDKKRKTIEHVIRERFGNKVIEVVIQPAENEAGEDVLFIQVFMTKDTTAKDFSGRFFGLTGRVRDALGDDMRGVFPFIRPMEAHA